MPVGHIVTSAGRQGCETILGSMRSIPHALRAWPTRLGVTVNTANAELSTVVAAALAPKSHPACAFSQRK
jgi:FMN reductase